MFFPQKMYLVKIFVLKNFLDELSQVLYDFGVIEIEKASNFISREDGMFLVDTKDFIQKCRELKEALKKTLNQLDIRRDKKSKEIFPVKISTQILDEIQQDYGGIISRVGELNTKIEENQKRIEDLSMQSTILELIEEKGLDLEYFKGPKTLAVKIGVVPEEAAQELEAYNSESIFIEIARKFLGKAIVFCVSLREEEEHLYRILKSVKFEEVFLDFHTPDLDENIESIELDIWKLREESAECRRKLKEIKKEYQEKLLYALTLLEENGRIYQVMNSFLASRAGYVVTGWVPASKIKLLKHRLKDFKGRVYIESEPVDSLIEKGLSFKNVPSYLGHKLFKPFELILKFYGIPAYRHIDPTVFMSLSFITMFGMMFADLGHGLSLTVLGLILVFFRALRDFARILIWCGLSGAFFGIMFGSFFGREDFFNPLWFSPATNPERFLFIGICLGIIMITSGIILNIFQNLKNKNVREVFFSQWGTISIIFYWLLLYLIAISVRYHALNISLGWLFGILLIPLLAITLGNLFERDNPDMAEAIFRPVEIVLSLVTNTISFIRVSAFGLAHAALAGCVYLIASSLKNLPPVRESIIIEGNIGIILFEGLIVFIQALRLEFYEFFSKFFQLQGREFKPLRERG